MNAPEFKCAGCGLPHPDLICRCACATGVLFRKLADGTIQHERKRDALKIEATIEATDRGFAVVRFDDYYGSKCSLQKSSLATRDAIWLGVDSHFSTGASARMHLTQAHVRSLLPLLTRFAETGEIGPMRIKATRLWINCRCFDGDKIRIETVSAWKPDGVESLAVHGDRDWWWITHIPTGLATPHRGFVWMTKAGALEAAVKLEECCPILKTIKIDKTGRKIANEAKMNREFQKGYTAFCQWWEEQQEPIT